MQYQKEEVRNRILCAAYGEFFKYGFYRTSMLQISNKAKVPIGNLYRYFQNKEALYEAIVGAAYSETINTLSQIYENWLKIDKKSVISTEFAYSTAKILAELASKHKEGITLLVENSDGSPYAGFKAKLDDTVYKMFTDSGMFPGSSSDAKEDLFLKILSINITEGVLTIITRCDECNEVGLYMKLLLYYFGNMEGRIYQEGTIFDEKNR